MQVVALADGPERAVKRLRGALPVLVAADIWEDTGEELDDTFLPDAEIWRRTSSGGAYNAEVCHACLCSFCDDLPRRASWGVQGRMESAACVHLVCPALGAQSVHDAQTCIVVFKSRSSGALLAAMYSRAAGTIEGPFMSSCGLDTPMSMFCTCTTSSSCGSAWLHHQDWAA